MKFLAYNGAIKRMETIEGEATGDTSTRSRTLLYVPANLNIPDIISPIVNDSYIEIRDVQTWDDSRPFHQSSVITPCLMGDVVCTRLTLTIDEVEGDKSRCVHTLEGECDVSIPWLGPFVEQAIISNMQTFYDTYNEHVKAFVKMVTRTYGDGSEASLDQAVKKLT
ncbi:hypothetical protein FGB62_6g010 [Gracilaria domingensis]|nr:hypothetical protein FGB62_6g010 [Gracilaria domingensis]